MLRFAVRQQGDEWVFHDLDARVFTAPFRSQAELRAWLPILIDQGFGPIQEHLWPTTRLHQLDLLNGP